MEPKKQKRRIEFQKPKAEKKRPNKLYKLSLLQRIKKTGGGGGEKPNLKETIPKRKGAEKWRKNSSEKERHKATMVQKRESEEEREKKGSLKRTGHKKLKINRKLERHTSRVLKIHQSERATWLRCVQCCH